jgi:hypothetical protein
VAPLGKTGKNMNYTEEESPILSPPFNPPWITATIQKAVWFFQIKNETV